MKGAPFLARPVREKWGIFCSKILPLIAVILYRKPNFPSYFPNASRLQFSKSALKNVIG